MSGDDDLHMVNAANAALRAIQTYYLEAKPDAPPADAIAALLTALGQFSGKFGYDDWSAQRYWQTLCGQPFFFVAGFEAERRNPKRKPVGPEPTEGGAS